jgi:C-terminal processing protease CtpA/Prc
LGIIDFRLSNEGIRIVSILRDSLADMVYGIQPGTVITKINEKPVLEFSKEDLRTPDFYRSVHEYSVLEEGQERTIIVPLIKHEILPSN